MRVQKKSLGPQLTKLARGGLGEVFRVGGFHLPGDPADLAYKHFIKDEAIQGKSAEAAVAFRAGLRPADRSDLDSWAAWPRAIVEDPPGTITGLLMPLVQAEFFCRMIDPDTGAPTDKPLEMSWLAAAAQQRAAAGLNLRDVDKIERLILLGKLIYAVGRLHKHGWVFGDLSLRNAVFALDPPRVMLLDCDGAASLSDPARRQATTPHWDPPECPPRGTQRLQDDRTDMYKLGLAILRCMSPGKHVTTTRDPDRMVGALDPEGVTLVTDALGTDKYSRPSAKKLYDYFYRVVSASIMPPVAVMARLRNPLRVRGQDVRIDWQISHASTVTVIAGHQRFLVDLSLSPDGYVFRPDESGPVAIEMTNRFGSLRVELGDVTLYELPPFKVDFGFLPTPRIPPVPAFPTAALQRLMEQIPAALLPDLPAVPDLDTFGVVESLMRSAALPVPLPQLGKAVTDVSAALTAALQPQADQVSASLRAAYLVGQGQAGN